MEQKEKLRQLAEDIPALCLAMKEKDTSFLAKILAWEQRSFMRFRP